MKKYLLILAVLLVLAVCPLFLREDFSGWESPDILTKAQSRHIQQELFRAAEACGDAKDTDAVEDRLIDAGFATLDSDAVYPAYLVNADGLRAFAAGAEAVTVLKASDGGGFVHMFFARGKEDFLILTEVSRDSRDAFYVSHCETLPLYEAELAAWDVFYYRCYPANDPHYIDYSYFRLTAADREKYDLTRKYILPVGYRMVNLFLCNWQEENLGNLSINDTFEYLYEIRTGEAFPWQEYPVQADTGYRLIPAGLFEDTILPFFAISQETLRAAAHYNEAADCYPWRAMYGDDLTAWELPVCQPEVVACSENPEGTLTLTVQVASPEKKTNALFTHEITVRPLKDGGFQYVENRITNVGDWGLLPATARMQTDF